MRLISRTNVRRAVCAFVSASMLLQPMVASAALLDLAKSPLFVTPPIPPLVMLDISKDQQLFKKAYNDYSDLDGDGKLETSYKHSVNYYGYFDSYKCYDYVADNNLVDVSHFAPVSYTANKYCTGNWSGNFLNWATMTRMDTVRKLLFGGMRRNDKNTSPSGTKSSTSLERANLPSDAHAFAKFYDGTDLNQLTPFSLQTTPTKSATITTTARNVQVAASSRITFDSMPTSFTNKLSPGDQIRASSQDVNGGDGTPCKISGRMVDKNTAGTTMTLWVDTGGSFAELDYDNIDPDTKKPALKGTTSGATALNCSGGVVTGATTSTKWVFENLSSVGISICNVTAADADQFSHSTGRTPRMRMVKGNYDLWAANERFQCYWHDEKNNLQGGFLSADQQPSSNGNQYSLSTLAASAENPANSNGRTFLGGGSIEKRSLGFGVDAGEYRVIVQACHKDFTPAPAAFSLLTTEKCKQYDKTGEYKPIGLLQVYGDDGRISFGLITGSYKKNISGGVLRKNVGGLSDEIDSSGRFKSNPSNGSIIGTLSKLRIYGYAYSDGTYIGSDDCTYQLTSAELVDNKCRSWGNPMSEIYAESLRYFSGATTPTAAFNADDSGLITDLKTATWPNPNNVLTKDNYCAPLNILVFNASVSSKDHDQVSNPFGGSVSFSAKTYTDLVGEYEGLNGKSFFVGSNDGSAFVDAPYPTSTNNGLCDAKPFSGGGSLGSVQGICPEAPSLNGTYLMSGLAYAARTNRIRDDLNSNIPATDKRSLKVATYGISLATNVPRIEVAVPGSSSGQKIIIQPTYRLTNARGVAGRTGSGAIVDVMIVSQETTSTFTKGRMYVNWEDSEQGGDYDQDVWGVIDYKVTATTTEITTNVVAASTANPQGFGYTISGTTKDGPHFHAGIYNFNYTDPKSPDIYNPSDTRLNGTGVINASGGCVNCNAADVATTAKYTNSSAGAAFSLNDPLWYAAKYGGFTDLDGDGKPNKAEEFDNFVNATGAPGSDGVPDNFFLVSNPLGLETALEKLFTSILQRAAASAVAANSSKLNTGTRVFQAVFNPAVWSGSLLAFGVNPSTGVPNTNPDWDAGTATLASTNIAPDDRVILSYNKGVSGSAPVGVKFRLPSDPASPTASELTAAQLNALRINPSSGSFETVPSPYVAADDPANKRLLYLRGSGANEGSNVTNYRARPLTKFGDVINSNPNFVGAPSAGFPDATYVAFANTYKDRKTLLYVGANDGMLHAFNACPPSSDSTRPAKCSVGKSTQGAELLGYIPSPVYRNLSKLTALNYSHEYFVDGSPVVEDALVGTSWKSVLVGGLNRGGQGIYALDVSDPEAFTEANASSLALWEFTDADDPDLGFTFGTPVITRMRNGKFAAIVSAGYNNSQGALADSREIDCASGTGTTADPYLPAGCTVSRTGYGYIFVIFLSGPSGPNGKWVQGTDYIKLSTKTGNPTTPNGVASPFAADTNGDGQSDVIYAGDLNGALWRFDVSSTTPATWATDASRVLLFEAKDGSGNVQPITAGLEAALHPSGQGVMVAFGTGKYLELSDIGVTPSGSPYPVTHSLYGIWDKFDGSTTPTPVSGRSSLMKQLLQPGIAENIRENPDKTVSRITTIHQPNYGTTDRSNPDVDKNDGAALLANQVTSVSTVPSTPANQRGWYLDLFNKQVTLAPAGERMIYTPLLRSGVLLFASLWPEGNVCLGSTSGDNITLMIGTGARPDASVFDLDANSLVNAADMVNVAPAGSPPILVAVSSRRVVGGSAQPPTLVAKGTQYVGFQNPTGGTLEKLDLKLPNPPGRVSWREILY